MHGTVGIPVLRAEELKYNSMRFSSLNYPVFQSIYRYVCIWIFSLLLSLSYRARSHIFGVM